MLLYHDWHVQGKLQLKGRVILCLERLDLGVDRIIQVVKLSGKRRIPFCARVMSDERDIITGKKKQICIGTFATREEALNALSIYSLKRSNAITNEEAKNLAPDLFDRLQEKNAKESANIQRNLYYHRQ